MYKYDRAITLVTIASNLNENLALLDVGESINAESLACAHQGYINVIPILNSNVRCKYVPLQSGKNRGEGIITQVKWLRVNGETVFVVASTKGLQIYDAEVCDVRLSHACKVAKHDMGYTKGICVIEGSIICIGTYLGTVWTLEINEDGSDFKRVNFFQAHEEAVEFLDGIDSFLVTASEKITYLWVKDGNDFYISRKIEKNGILQKPTALKVSHYMIFIGYDSGELSIYDIQNPSFLVQTVAHKLQITDIDFSWLTRFVLTASEDGRVKIWTFNKYSSQGECVFSIFNGTGPVCGVAFLNYNCTEFCAVTANDTNVNIYIQEEKCKK